MNKLLIFFISVVLVSFNAAAEQTGSGLNPVIHYAEDCRVKKIQRKSTKGCKTGTTFGIQYGRP